MTWLVPHTTGPVSARPATRNSQLSAIEAPDATTPHRNAHIGGNQVTGLASSTTSFNAGTGVKGVGRAVSDMEKGYA